MKKMKKFLALFLSLLMILPLASLGVSAAQAQESRYEINNPYATVDFKTWKAYKTQLHAHSNASDGYLTVKEFVQRHYDLGYDAVALTDHATLNYGWNKVPDTVPIIRLVKYERTKLAKIEPLSDEEYQSYLNGTAKTTNGTVRSNGMLDIPLGIELNGATPVSDCHLTGYFSHYGNGLIGVYGDYETPSAGVKADGGISMLSHVGEYVFIDKDSENYVGQPVDDYYANKFARLFLDNAGSSVGMGINSADDEHTRCDRILYDQILMKTIPNGVTPWAFSFSDSHNEEVLDRAYTMHYMPELTNEALRTGMENGTLFAISHRSNGVELNGMRELPEDFVPDDSNATPLVTDLTVNNNSGTISFKGTDFDTVTWIADGNVIKRGGKEAATINLNDYDIECFVRFYITGKGGICYSQPFAVKEKGAEVKKVDVPKTYDLPFFLRTLVTVLDKLIFSKSVIIKVFKKIVLGY